MLGGRSDFEFRKTPISHRTRILARSRSVRLTASSAGEALHFPAAGLAAAGSPYLRECTLSSVRLRFPRRACRLTSFFCLGGGARNLVCLPRRTRSPVRFRFGYSTSMLGVLPHIFSRFPAPRIGFGRCALLLPLFRIGCEYVPPPPRAPFSPNTYPAWGAEHPRTGARRAP